MAGSKSDYLENKLLGLALGATAYTPAVTVYAGLFTTAPTDAGGGTELTGNNYTRVGLTNNTTNFATPTVGSVTNAAAWTFPILSGTTSTVVAVGFFDAFTSGNLLYWCDLAAGYQKAYAANDQPVIPISGLVVTED
jgi:hypothetical protein